MNNPARFLLPDEWTKLARCPVCTTLNLQVHHIEDRPDQMFCTKCGTIFMVEEHGSRIWISELPPMLESHKELKEKWITVNNVKEFIHSLLPPARADIKGPVTPVRDTSTEGDDVLENGLASERLECVVEIEDRFSENDKLSPEVEKKVIDLYRLGNSPEIIEDILKRADDLSPQQIHIAVGNIVELENIKRTKQIHMLWIVGIITLVCLLGIIGALFAWSIFGGYQGGV